ncbi:probable peptidyl-tRNA hydrolase 2 [Montipora capricornis]|uniref:probable peptidyl-tRNA hydrolase 2 n=1 Tax=Montipora foliosa TaxID=591990 RepID=UPI0035F195C7
MADGEGVYGPTEHTEQRLPRVRRRSQWEGPNEEFMKMLLDLGISKNAAEKALFMTDNSSVDAAASWVLDNQELPDLDEPFKSDSFPALEAHAFERSFPLDEMTTKSPYKMVFVVNTELQMGLGKIAAQVGHAAVGLYKILTAKPEKYDYMVSQWEDFGGTKIVLKGNNSAHLFDLEDLAQKAHIPYYLVHDAGKTQVAAGSLTVIGLFGSSSEVGTITGTLLLL